MGIAAILGLILPAIPSLIDLVEDLVKAPKSGETRMSTVMQQVRALITAISATTMTPLAPGAVAPKGPTDEELRAVIQTIFAQKEAAGTLGKVAAQQQICLLQGTFTITPLVAKS